MTAGMAAVFVTLAGLVDRDSMTVRWPDPADTVEATPASEEDPDADVRHQA